MAKQFLTGLNLNKNELLNARIQNLASAPLNAVEGQLYYDTVDLALKVYSDGEWKALAVGGNLESAIDSLRTELRGYANDAVDDHSDETSGVHGVTGNVVGTSDTQTLTNKTLGSGTALGANLDANSNKITNLADPTNTGDAASKGYVDTSIVNATDDITDAYVAADTALNTSLRTYIDGEITDVTTAYQSADDALETAVNLYTDTAITTATNSITTAYTAAVDALETELTSYVDTEISDLQTSLRSEIAAASQGLDIKNSVRAATTANITLSGEQTIDGVSVVADDRVLVKSQADASENGIYVVAAGSWSRAEDAGDEQLSAGSFTFVEEGTVNADSGFVISTDGAITVGTTNIEWTQFSGTGQIVAGNGITKTGSELSVTAGSGITVDGNGVSIASDYVGQTSITTVGTITTGTWNGSTIDVAHGGTGATTLTGYVVGNGTDPLSTVSVIPGSDINGNISGNAANVTGTVAIANGGTGATTAAAARSNLGAITKYAEGNTTLNPSSGIVTWTVSHNLGTLDVTVAIRETSGNSLVEADVVITNTNTVTISWNASESVSADSYRVVVTG